ncbi:hemolysin family protein [Patescibacteria group bacterium]
MDYSILATIIFILFLLVISGWFAGVETALTSLTPVEIAGMRKHKVANVEYVLKLKKNMEKTIVAILIANNVVNILISSLTALVADALFHKIGVSIAVALITFLLVVFGEITPKSRAIILSKRIVSKNAKIVYYLVIILNPLIKLFIKIAKKFLHLINVPLNANTFIVSDQKIKDLVELGRTEGVVKKIESDIIKRVFYFGDHKCKGLMVPLKEVFSLNQDMKFSHAKKKVSDRGFTRVPLKNENGRIVGLIYAKDLLNVKRGSIKKMRRPVIYVSEDTLVSRVLDKMKRKRMHLAVVHNKDKKQVGIITLEDILEKLVGEIYDESYRLKYANNSQS